VAIVLGVVGGIVGSRVVRGAAFTVASQPYVDSARAIGCSNLHICRAYMVPNVLPLVIVLATVNIGSSIIAAASLSFVGYGIRPPTADWGDMLSGQGRLFMVAAPWLFYGPTIALALVVFSVNMLGDALRDSLDPRLRGG
jgi:peptide/nickel transport system permease protein